jgi:DNA-binding MarR family transcriptional regulator
MAHEHEALAAALLQFGPLYRSWVEQCAPVDCQGARVRLLTMLYHKPSLPMGFYARILGISKAHMTTVVDDFLAADLVTRSHDTHDRRAVHLCLTDKGRVQAEAVWEQWVTQSARAFADVTEAEKDVFLAVCRTVSERMHGTSCPLQDTSC